MSEIRYFGQTPASREHLLQMAQESSARLAELEAEFAGKDGHQPCDMESLSRYIAAVRRHDRNEHLVAMWDLDARIKHLEVKLDSGFY